MSIDKTNPKYLADPKLHHRDLCDFRDKLGVMILGEEDKQWRSELDFIRDRTIQKISEVRAKLL
jgi:hypothetical protein